jgi:hypothetical protein
MQDTQFEFPFLESSNPIELLDAIAQENKWPLEKISDEEASLECEGRWGQFALNFLWQEDFQALLFSCTSDLRVPVKKIPAIKDMLFEVNSKTWLGHFDLDDSDDRFVLFRYTSLMRGYTLNAQEHVEDLIELAMTEFDRFYPAFKAVLSERKIANDVMVTMLADPMGEA